MRLRKKQNFTEPKPSDSGFASERKMALMYMELSPHLAEAEWNLRHLTGERRTLRGLFKRFYFIQALICSRSQLAHSSTPSPFLAEKGMILILGLSLRT